MNTNCQLLLMLRSECLHCVVCLLFSLLRCSDGFNEYYQKLTDHSRKLPTPFDAILADPTFTLATHCPTPATATPTTYPILAAHATFPSYTVVRFLRARKGNVDKGALMMFHWLKWRDEYGVEDLCSYVSMPAQALLSSFVFHCYFSFDSQGRPIYIEKPGKIDVPKFVKEVSDEAVLFTQ